MKKGDVVMKYMVWSYGYETQRLLELGLLQISDIVAFIDVQKRGKTEFGVEIVSPQQGLKKLRDVECVLVTVRRDVVKREIYAQALTLGYPDEKILFVYNICNFAKVHEQNEANLQKISSGLPLEQMKQMKQEQQMAIDSVRPFMPFVSLEFDGLQFIFRSRDIAIPSAMIQNQAVYPKLEMEFCLQNCQMLGRAMDKGIFLEIGANVGTTTLYMHNRLGREWRYYAFEPMEENYKLLQVNCLLNNCADIICENKGVTDSVGGQMCFYFNTDNSGGSGVVTGNQKKKSHMVNERIVNCTTVDNYLDEKNISAEEVGLVWIDVEGHEPAVISGGKKTFQFSLAPCYLEFNYQDYEKQGTLKSFVRDLQDIYDKFICYEQFEKGWKKPRPVAELEQLADELRNYVPHGNIILWKDGK